MSTEGARESPFACSRLGFVVTCETMRGNPDRARALNIDAFPLHNWRSFARCLFACLALSVGCTPGRQPAVPREQPVESPARRESGVERGEAAPEKARAETDDAALVAVDMPAPDHKVPGLPKHFYGAYIDEGTVHATLWDLAPDAWDTLGPAIERQRFEFAADDLAIPPYLRRATWWGVDGHKVFELELVGFEIVGGASDSSLEASFRAAGGAKISDDESPQLVVMGKRPTYGEVEGVDMPGVGEFDAPVSELAGALRPTKTWPPTITAALRAQADKKVEDLTVVRLAGRFGPAAEVVAINARVVGEGVDEESYLSGLAVLDAEGEILGWPVKLDVRIDEVILDGVTRFAPDGLEHLNYTLRYYEGAYQYMLVWTEKGWEDWSTGGDGA